MDKLDLFNLRRNVARNVARRVAGNGLTTAGRFFEQPSTSSADIADAQNAYSRQGLQAGALAEANRGMSNVEAARLRALKALGASQQPTASVTKPKLITADDTASGLRSMLPGRGTPGSAALGAFGSTMSQLGGWQDKPMTFGQILGASLGKAREAYGTAEERQRQIAAEKSAAERQAMLDEYKLRELQVKEAKEKREAGAKPKRESKVVDGSLYEKNPETGKWEVAVAKTQDAKTPSSTLFTVNIPGENPLSLRADDPELDKYLGESGKALGARVTKAGQLVGSKDEVLSGLTKAEYSKQVVKAFDAKENIIRLENVKDTFDDNFLRLGGKIDLAVAKAADWGNFASKEQTDLIKRVSDWQLKAWNQVNDRIKAITGAQMSEAEAKRIMKELPDPTNADFFKISSPAEYKAKLETALENAKLAVARQQYFLSKGLEPSFYKTERTESNPRGYDVFYESGDGVLGLDGTKSLMKKEAADLAEKYKDLPYEERRSAIKSDMQSIFGLGV